MRGSRKCGRCGSREDVTKGRRIPGYGSVCPPCYKLCSFPVEEVAVGLAALATGAIRLPLGFSSYKQIRERREAQERAAAEREAQERAEAEERDRAATDSLRERVREATSTLRERAVRPGLSRRQRRQLRERLSRAETLAGRRA